jgi:homoserine kinase
MRVRAYAPASIGNVAAGFDVLGAALAPIDGSLLGDIVEVAASDTDRFTTVGPFAHRLPSNADDNLVVKSRRVVEEALGRALGPLDVTLHKNLPVSSGLGSSSASAVAAVKAFDAIAGSSLDAHALLMCAAKVEDHAAAAAHLDNVAPCLLGGLRLCLDERTVALPWPDDLRFVVASPALELETKVSRGVLPRELPMATGVAFAGNLAGLVHALHAGDRALLGRCLRDLVAEPHRARLIPGFRDTQARAKAAGALGCSLSGAGPAVFAVATDADAPAVAESLSEGFAAANVASTVRVCRLDTRGARLLAEGEA